MIIYKKGFGAINLLFRVYGSAWPRALILAVPSAVAAGFIKAYANDHNQHHFFLHPYPYSVFASMLAFLIIFRTNLSYAVSHDGLGTDTFSALWRSSKWADAVVQVITFDESAKEPAVPGGTQFRAEFIHAMSLMHALAMQRLRGDDDLTNLIPGSLTEISKPPPYDAAEILEWKKRRGLKGYIILQSQPKHFKKYWQYMPIMVIGGLSGAETVLLQETTDRVYMLMCWVHRAMVARRTAGGIKEDAPIVSRIYQVLSDGMLGFENAHKIGTTPFPFPYAQCVAILLYIYAFSVPLLMAGWIGNIWLTVCSTFVAVLSFFLINEVAREIEEPYNFDPNDLPVTYLHHKFNSRLIIAFCKSLLPKENIYGHIQASKIRSQLDSIRLRTFGHQSESRQRSLDIEVNQGVAVVSPLPA
eukprot:SM000051S17590  [mRNA]  locus=s51:527683:530778:- [translate_table: standard]